jgi:hypothetical protein
MPVQLLFLVLCTKSHINTEFSSGQVGFDTGENILRKQVDEQILEKIRELEHCAAKSGEVSKGTQIQEIAAKKICYIATECSFFVVQTLQILICKQQELTGHIEQLRKILQ